MSYREALRSGKARQSYIKGGINIFNPIDGFKVGYKFGHDTLGPALLSKKYIPKQHSYTPVSNNPL